MERFLKKAESHLIFDLEKFLKYCNFRNFFLLIRLKASSTAS